MNSQICENPDEPRKTDTTIADADRRIEEINERRAAIAERRRALMEPTEKVVVANPSAIHHKITLGGVMVNAGFQAADADALAGLLDLEATILAARIHEAVNGQPGKKAAGVIADLLDINQRELAARGLFLTWQKRLALYLEDRAEWLARDEEHRLRGEWRNADMTADQRWLIRATCRVLRIAMPGHLRRGQAADWLEAHGANLNFGDFQ
ncbi:hypothetical protein [Porphyrobacter sp. YT40]|uniref:hypothetical protein n=1 Tax=Porphyrobacter sp. YT40 TaxID=2547601 RepID=UPI001142D51F|nr:hypothetical protein [Porphyrobacter sp. YT40]QDH35119.1 hypothetical protein E2E27_12780 [Porphyrobacter sp. YT40]